MCVPTPIKFDHVTVDGVTRYVHDSSAVHVSDIASTVSSTGSMPPSGSAVYNAIQNMAPRNNGIYYVPGTGSVASSSVKEGSTTYYTAAYWRGPLTDIDTTNLQTGTTINYKIDVAGNATYGTLLCLNTDSDPHPVVYRSGTSTANFGTQFGVGCIATLVYDATLTKAVYVHSVSTTQVTFTGCWTVVDYDSNTNTIGYQLRTNYTSYLAKSTFYRYRLLFTSADHQYWIPANTSSSTNVTAVRTVPTDKIDPFGEIVFYGTTTKIDANTIVTAAQLWQQYFGTALRLGYSFNVTGSAISLESNKELYLKCTPQSDGSAIIDPSEPYTQILPSTDDGKIYILLGRALQYVSGTTTYPDTFELLMKHPIYYYKNGSIRLWTGQIASHAYVENNEILIINEV